MNEALAAQKKNPKKILIDVYTKWCGPCRLLDKNTFQNKDVAKYINEKFYAVKFNGEGNEVVTYQNNTFKNPNYDPARSETRNSPHQFANALGINAYPTIVFLNEKGEMLFPLPGYHTPTQIEPMLKLIGENSYLKIKTQQEYNDYLKNFKGTFKG